ncbi:unnamed protein product [Microthlaspi erraticum]|uniref:Reverse transcriptase domain-containing protein n=1 Tax=Microthlaspi erraticum TaxID=1685480 RepID=A0A6D2IZS8_9BRAS|nr:unnamed protein product [Microthlaspi erraticum]
MGFTGPRFTWKRGREERYFVAKRLDRILCNAQARLRWQGAIVKHLPYLSSDHTPLYLQLEPGDTGDPRRRPFRFEAAWLKHSGFKELLLNSWNGALATPNALEDLKVKLRKWNKEVFGDIQTRKEKLLTEIKAIQALLESTQTDALLQREGELLREFYIVLEQEEVLWYQKSREKGITLGDRNTKYYHLTTVVRRRRNKIESLKDDEGHLVTQPRELEKLATDYYRKLYSLDDVDAVVERLNPDGFMRLTWAERNELNKAFSARDVESSIRSMRGFKAPGPDGYQPVFYQDSWDVVGESVARFALEFFRTGVLPPGTNDAIVVLIAKVMKPEKITQFRPISLCNVLFKTITKMMVMRLKRIMPKLIGPAQSSFIPGRLSTDNIVLVQEAMGLFGGYFESVEAPGELGNMDNACVTGPAMTILWNGEQTEPFAPRRGLRQGDPLSPYLFVLCLERLCHLIEEAIDLKKWKPIQLSRGGPKISHVCFAYDLILFAEASVTQVQVIRQVLEKFCVASGQKVSLEKSKIFFSENVSRELGKLISDESGI